MPMTPLFDGALFALEAGRALADEVVPRHFALAAVVAGLDPARVVRDLSLQHMFQLGLANRLDRLGDVLLREEHNDSVDQVVHVGDLDILNDALEMGSDVGLGSLWRGLLWARDRLSLLPDKLLLRGHSTCGSDSFYLRRSCGWRHVFKGPGLRWLWQRGD